MRFNNFWDVLAMFKVQQLNNPSAVAHASPRAEGATWLSYLGAWTREVNCDADLHFAKQWAAWQECAAFLCICDPPGNKIDVNRYMRHLEYCMLVCNGSLEVASFFGTSGKSIVAC